MNPQVNSLQSPFGGQFMPPQYMAPPYTYPYMYPAVDQTTQQMVPFPVLNQPPTGAAEGDSVQQTQEQLSQNANYVQGSSISPKNTNETSPTAVQNSSKNKQPVSRSKTIN